MTIKNGRDPISQVDDSVRYVCHANGIIPCPQWDASSDRARAEWRRNPDTGRLQMHWLPSHALPSKALPSRALRAGCAPRPSAHGLSRVCASRPQGNAAAYRKAS
jgi:hypothetical protein